MVIAKNLYTTFSDISSFELLSVSTILFTTDELNKGTNVLVGLTERL